MREIDERPRIYLQDVQTVLRGCQSETLGSGEIFGELAAMTRSANTFTVIAEEPCVLLKYAGKDFGFCVEIQIQRVPRCSLSSQ